MMPDAHPKHDYLYYLYVGVWCLCGFRSWTILSCNHTVPLREKLDFRFKHPVLRRVLLGFEVSGCCSRSVYDG